MEKLIQAKNNEIYYYGHSLTDLAKKYGTPLKITFLDVIKNRIMELKNSFDKAIKETNYKGKFIYLNANKANYGASEVETAYEYSDGLETSSYYDLLFTHDIFRKNNSKKLLVCNGYKLNDYIDSIVTAYNEGFDIIDVIDSMSEYLELKKKNIALKVGLRVHLASLYSEEHEVIKNDRFGLTKEEFEYIIDDIKNTKLILNTIHFHQRGFDYEEEKFKENFVKAFEEYYVYAATRVSTIENYDIGGGTPLPVDGEFDYDKWAKYVITLLHDLASKHNLKDPNLLSENGKYSQKDATVNVYKVIGIKNTDEHPWYIVDSSLLIAMPEFYALGEPIIVKPINELDKPKAKARLAGVTCDCDDVYFESNKGYIDMPISNKELFIGLLGTGSYQNSMNGKGGVHHCLLPEEKDIVIHVDDKIEVRHELQSIDDIYKLISFKK